MPLPTPLCDRIRATFPLSPILRRAVAAALHAELTTAGDSLANASNWKLLASLLHECEVELYPRPHMVPPGAGDLDRALEFSALADDAHSRAVMMRVRCERDALRATRRTHRIIDAVCVEVAS